MADVKHFWSNVQVGSALHLGEINTYEEYLKICNLNGVSPYNEETFNTYIVETQNEITKRVIIVLNRMNPELKKLDKVSIDVGFNNYIEYGNSLTYGEAVIKEIENVKEIIVKTVLVELKHCGVKNTTTFDAAELVDNLMDSLDGADDTKEQVYGHIKELVIKNN
ncbi:MAG: hypothetical protein ACC656_01245 [Candidatus Heimdallarchaeota archaeon]